MEVDDIVETLAELEDDPSVPRSIKNKISEMIQDMQNGKDLSLTVNKSLSDLDDISSDVNLPPFIRTQIMCVASMLEQLE